MTSKISSFRQVFRLMIVLSSLYLMGDVFYRWDGFKYYGSFSDFLPGVALITVLFTVVSMSAAMVLWMLVSIFRGLFTLIGRKIEVDHIPVFILSLCVLIPVALTLWTNHNDLFQFMLERVSEFQTKMVLLLCIFLVAIFIAWVLRNKHRVIQEGITPLVWLFGIWFMFSLSLVVYHSFIKETSKAASDNTSRYSAVDGDRPNILLVTFDALRAESMSVYGYQKETTPFITKWAKEAAVFEKAEAEGNYTYPTTISLMRGQRLWTHQNYHSHGYVSKEGTENIPALLRANGYYNMMYSANGVASAKVLGIFDSFEIAPGVNEFYSADTLLGKIDRALCRFFCDKIKLHDWILKRSFMLHKFLVRFSNDNSKTLFPPKLAFNKFLDDLDKNPPEPFFAWVHIMPPHDPYLPPEPFKGMFNPSSQLRTLHSQSELMNFPRNAPFTEGIKKKIDTFRDRYDEFIRYCDKNFEDFIARLSEKGKLKNTIVILSADHGESFEHDYLLHGGDHLYEQVTHVPLIIWEPDQKEGRFIDALAEQIDIPATILDLANVPVPLWMEGRSLVPLMRGEELPYRPTFSMALDWNRKTNHMLTKGTFATWENEYKLIHYYNQYENKSLLYNLEEDPQELHDLFKKEPEIGRRLLDLIMDNLEKANKRIMEKQ